MLKAIIFPLDFQDLANVLQTVVKDLLSAEGVFSQSGWAIIQLRGKFSAFGIPHELLVMFFKGLHLFYFKLSCVSFLPLPSWFPHQDW